MWISRITQILTENHVNITNHSTISSTHCPHAIRRIALQSQHACGLALMNITYCNHSAKDLHLSISTWTQRRRLRGMNQKWPRHVALRKRVLDELIMDVWTETIQHEENAEREKHEQTVILKSNSGWKTFWKTTAMRERKPHGNKTGCAPTPFHPQKRQPTTHRHFKQHTLANPAKWFKLHSTLNDEETCVSWCVLAWNETRFHLVDTPTPTNFNLLRLRYNTWLNKHEQQLADTLLHLHSHTEKTAQREEPKRISSRHSATEVCRMNSSPTSPVTQHTDQQTSQTNQKHESKIWHWDMASGQDLCENNLHARTWEYQLLQLSTSQTTQHKNIKHTGANNLNFTNYAWSVVVGKQRRQDRQKRGETKGNLPNTLPKRNPTNCAAITTRWWACTHELDVRQTLREKHLHLKISTWEQRRRPRGMNQKWPRHVALRKKVLNELTMDVSTGFKTELQANEETDKNPKGSLEKYLRMKNLINNNLESDWLNPDSSGPTRKRHNATTFHVTDRHRADRMSRTIHWFSLRRTCFPWDLLAQARTTTGRHSVALATPTLRRLQRERRNKEDLVTSLCDRGVPDELITDVSSDATHWPTDKPNEPETSTKKYDIET